MLRNILPESQGQNPASTVLHVPSSFDSGLSAPAYSVSPLLQIGARFCSQVPELHQKMQSVN